MRTGWRRWMRIWVPALLFGGLVWAHRWICDDGFIYLHVADNLLSGLGPVFNPGERVEAYTSPLWLALISLAGAILKPVSHAGLPPFEWIAVGLGVASSIGAYAFASIGTERLWRSGERGVPVGGLVVLGLVPFWDYGTSGLESSLVLLWLGLSFAGMVWVRDQRERPIQILAAVCVGLGPLVRPDLGIFSLLWGLVILIGLPGWRRRLEVMACGLALPVGYEVFRMGYFACLVPNTAIAKEAAVAAWAHGWLYFVDFETTYQIWIPLLALGTATVWSLSHLSKASERTSVLVVAASVVGGILQALYVIGVGGDFLHARMLLPATFALALPVFTLPLREARWFSPILIAWGIGCLLFATVRVDPEGIGLERGRLDYISESKNDHPVTDADHREMHWESATELLEQIRGYNSTASWFFSSANPHPLQAAELRSWVSPRIEGVAYETAVGLFGYEARQQIYVCDGYGLADPFGARAELSRADSLTGRGKVGHEKWLQQEWCLAHLVEALNGRGRYSTAVSDLAYALVCGDLGELYAAVDEPLSWRRFWKNVQWSTRLTRLRIPTDPSETRRRFCGVTRP